MRQHRTQAVRGCLCSASMQCACLTHTEHQQKQDLLVASLWCTDNRWISRCKIWDNYLWSVWGQCYQGRGNLIQLQCCFISSGSGLHCVHKNTAHHKMRRSPNFCFKHWMIDLVEYGVALSCWNQLRFRTTQRLFNPPPPKKKFSTYFHTTQN